ncbi:GGDEF-domain containing protein, partial [Enterobacter hormaechei]|nr:GGDEF-domain containing protein [Enterobacter hormaechei]HDC4297665.1 GGDEF-domain containing protein [Enterobacter hormaechei]
MNRILVGIIFSLFITTGYIAFLVYDRQQELQKLTHYTESWSVAQLVSEYYRFESWIGLYATETDDVTVDQVRMRLEIMLSQNDLLKEGGLGRYINSAKAHQVLALRLENILNYLDGHLEKM